MNLVLLFAFGLACILLLWLGQAAALLATGRRSVWVLPFRHGTDSAAVRVALKVALHLGLVGTIVGYPLAIGANPWAYHRAHFAWRGGPLLLTVILTVVLLAIPLLVSVAVGWIRWERRYDPAKLAGKVLKSFLIPVPLCLVEEPLFRGIILEQLDRAWGSFRGGEVLAVVVAAALFAAAHFLRPQKKTLLPLVGLFVLGLVLSFAYLHAGHNYLPAIALHAAGVWFIQVTRPFTIYRGPAWVIGYHSYPICGLAGIVVLLLLAVAAPLLHWQT